MGNCTVPTNCNQVCGTLKRMKEVFLINDEFYKNPFILSKVLKIRGFVKAMYYRRRFKLLHAKELNITFNHKDKPGAVIDLDKHPIILCNNILEIEKTLGSYNFDEKYYFKASIQRNLRKYCLVLPDNSIYHGYYN